MKTILTNMKRNAAMLWRDEEGAEGLEKVLIIAAIALPLLAVLLFFSGAIKDWITEEWGNVQDNQQDSSDNPF
ncbi:MAG: Flp family type IVb pilin [Phycisphaeraceae bacterium]